MLSELREIALLQQQKSPAAEVKMNGNIFVSFAPILDRAFIAEARVPVLIATLFENGITSVFALKQCTYDDLRELKFQIGEARALIAVMEGIEAFLQQVPVLPAQVNQPQQNKHHVGREEDDDETQLVLVQETEDYLPVESETEQNNFEVIMETQLGGDTDDKPRQHLDSDAESGALFGNSACY